MLIVFPVCSLLSSISGEKMGAEISVWMWATWKNHAALESNQVHVCQDLTRIDRNVICDPFKDDLIRRFSNVDVSNNI